MPCPPNLSAVLLTGTGTGVGKTRTALALALAGRAAGLAVELFKPFESGPAEERDSLRYDQLLGAPPPGSRRCTAAWERPLAPAVAARLAGEQAPVEQAADDLRAMLANAELVLVEGAGGLAVPIRDTWTYADLACEWNLPVVVVARGDLGTIHHTVTTVEYALNQGLEVLGVILAQVAPVRDPECAASNAAEIERLAGVPVWGELPHRRKPWDTARLARDGAPLFTRLQVAGQCWQAGQRTDWAALDQQHVWHPFTPQHEWLGQPPLMIARGQGHFLIDTDGKRYLDGVSSLWVNVHGHRQPQLDRAVRRQLGRLAHSTYLGLGHPPGAELARWLAQLAPGDLNRVFFSDDGSTATECAIKIAFQYLRQTGGEHPRDSLLAFTNAYHGDTLGAVSMGGMDLFHTMYQPLLFSAIRAPYPDLGRRPPGQSPEAYAQACLAEVRGLMETHRARLGAVMLEPLVQGAAGMRLAPPGFLKGLEQLCREFDLLLIVDEVATGFGRTGRMFACEHEQVSPDLMAVAKGLTGGYLPVAATLVTERVWSAFVGDTHQPRTFYHGHSYTANPLGCAAALANLELLTAPGFLEAVRARSAGLRTELAALENHPHVGEIRQLGLMAGVELVADRTTGQTYPAHERIGQRVCLAARAHGVILRPLGDVVVLMPPLTITPEELRQLVTALRAAMDEELG